MGSMQPQADTMAPSTLLDESSRENLRRAAAALDAAEAGGQSHAVSLALSHMAACYRSVRAMASAESHYEAALRWARSAGSTDQIVDLLCDLCETAAAVAEALECQQRGRGRGARERARDHVFEATTLVGQVADPGWEAKVLLRISDVLDRCGDHDDAAQLQVRALRLMSGSLHTGAPDHNLLPSLGRLADG
jgi:tetratricopeptide (TPR) repeat protein